MTDWPSSAARSLTLQENITVDKLTVVFVRAVWMAVDRARLSVCRPAGVSNAKVDIKLSIQVNGVIFYSSSHKMDMI